MTLSKLHYQIEARIARYLVRTILDEGMLISIDCGESIEISRSQNFNDICNAMAATDSDRVVVYCPLEAKCVGVFWLIYGNGEDLLSDYRDNAYCNRIADKVYKKFNL